VAVVGIARYTTPFGLTADNVDLLLTGQVFALFVVTVAAAEVALGLAIVITMYRTQGSVEVGEANIMRH
jgi:NADH:ubiquinone oxidoreductase subunit K